ncbi:oligosaccharide flippase family protein [Actinopolymorpha rutila]|uniref:O-antigen/teichoic acid export membrane protein n=1 Tax=Actinopolymorpha rutila TaxID=446787 RepID=A0A852ZCQ6_9ACTN|nr:oligosaccharide flippase family protein [Actinopolymorpha rutila]NYH90891.1 O-antigen/teichoic acid export membrane protein [Actinopolymorpha rutila]
MGAFPTTARAAVPSRFNDGGATAQVALFSGARFAGASLSAITAVVLARSLPKAEYGNLALLTGIVGLLVVLTDAGLTSSLARYLSEQRVDRQLFVRIVALRGALTGLAVLGILAYSAAGGAPGFGSATVLGAVLLVANSMVSLAHGTLPTLRRVGVGAFLTVFQPAVELCGVVVLVRTGPSAPAALVALTVAAGASAVTGLAVLFAHPVSFRERAGTSDLVRYALPLFGVWACVSVFGVVDQVLITLFHDAATVAPYALGWKLVVFLHLPAVAMAAVVAPRLAQDMRRAPEIFDRWMRRTAVTYAGVLSVVTPLAPDIFGLIGRQYRTDAPVLQALMGYAALLSVAPLVSLSCNFLGGGRARLPVALAAVAVNICLDLALIPTWGSYGAAVSSTLAYLVYVLGHVRIAARLLGSEPWSAWTRPAVRIAAGAVTSVCVTRFVLGGVSSLGLVGAGIAGAVGLASYVAVVRKEVWH